MALIDKVKLALRFDDDSLDGDIQDSINAAKADLKLSGILESKTIDETDDLITRAIKVFCKAEFSTDDAEAARYKDSYETLKAHLCLSTEYIEEVTI